MTETTELKCPLVQNKGYKLINALNLEIANHNNSYNFVQAIEVSSQDRASECENCFFKEKCIPESSTVSIHGKVLNTLIVLSGKELTYYSAQKVNNKSLLPISLYI